MSKIASDLIIGVAAVGSLFGMLALYVEQIERTNPPKMTTDTATIIVTAHLLESVGAKPFELTDDAISVYLTQFGYAGCRDRKHWDEIEVCRLSISKEEINLVRKAMMQGPAFVVAGNGGKNETR